MNYHTVSIHAKDPEARLLDIYLGEDPPENDEGGEIQTFRSEVDLHSFLFSGDWDRVSIFKSDGCDQETVDYLTKWISLNMGLKPVVQTESG